MSASLTRLLSVRSWHLTAALVLGGWLIFTNSAEGQPANGQNKQADDLVAEALQRQIYGQFEDSSRLLGQAMLVSPDCRAARWHSGQVYYTRKWLTVDAAATAAADDNRLTRYCLRREKTADTIEAQRQLAAWCRGEQLFDQERAHLTRVLELSPDDAQARAALDFVRVGNEWLTGDERKQREADLKTRNESLAAWKSTMEKYAKSLDATSVKRRAYAEGQIAAISDPTAIPALESILATHSEDGARLAVQALANLTDPEATAALSRIGVESRWAPIRTAAAKALQARPREQYVPALLTALSTPTRTRSELYQTPQGRLMLRQIFERDGQNSKQQQVVVTEYRRQALPGNNGTEATGRALADVQQRTAARTAAAEQMTAQDRQLNGRVMEVLGLATGANVVNDPNEWWTWWNQENDVYVSDAKPVQTATRTEQVVIRDTIGFGTPNNSAPAAPMSSFSARTCECLAAGTQVWTEMGYKAIETIKIGDRVLSQNVDTGELMYKPVLRTTVRASGPLVRLEIDGQYIRTSGGHEFWVAGDGWAKSRNLKSGAVLTALGAPVVLSSAQIDGEGKTFNLVVADFNTYFAGKSRVLCHDNTLRAPTKSVVPGLAAD